MRDVIVINKNLIDLSHNEVEKLFEVLVDLLGKRLFLPNLKVYIVVYYSPLNRKEVRDITSLLWFRNLRVWFDGWYNLIIREDNILDSSLRYQTLNTFVEYRREIIIEEYLK